MSIQWFEKFDKENQPDAEQVEAFVDTPLWNNLDSFLQQTCKIKPKLAHSSCAMDGGIWKGWNVKYKKGGKSVCTLYPKQGFFLTLLPVGLSEISETEMLMPGCTKYTQNLFANAPTGRYGKSLAFEVDNANVLDDLKNLIDIRFKSL